jgi:hypothetical protein
MRLNNELILTAGSDAVSVKDREADFLRRRGNYFKPVKKQNI